MTLRPCKRLCSFSKVISKRKCCPWVDSHLKHDKVTMSLVDDIKRIWTLTHKFCWVCNNPFLLQYLILNTFFFPKIDWTYVAWRNNNITKKIWNFDKLEQCSVGWLFFWCRFQEVPSKRVGGADNGPKMSHSQTVEGSWMKRSHPLSKLKTHPRTSLPWKRLFKHTDVRFS